MNTEKVWFVTGASKGLGLALVKQLLQAGYKVVATTRSIPALNAELSFGLEQLLPLEVNLTDSLDVKLAIEKSIAHFGKIDVIVNNAGYGQLGTIEELTDEEARQNFDVNVFGVLNVIRHAMPYLRAQQSGHIFNIASVGGYVGGFAGWGVYCSTKFAMAGFTEALAEEVKEFGVKVTLVYPGYFRTDFLSKGSLRIPQNAIQAYKEARESEHVHLNAIAGNQPNDPDKAASALIKVSNEQNPPVHLLLGKDAYDMVQQKIDFMTKQVEQWKEVSISTAY
ncbi:oxidoreductase [Flectobacillus sp. BAB-3569]|uniref:oxidoreductase n=1 Tax=Flectobacillus sp. BAB-3569 TaxID=1509483 RepID=UPI000BA3BBEB|nr:oxidoreductase [Flectobacillus sp. BAB-3569]PAC29275.1 short-chain dehydrogenase/reductase [Flectobacillus sp. BAB-3569]